MADEGLARPVLDGLNEWNKDFSDNLTLADNYSAVGTKFDTFINDKLFPKIAKTNLAQQKLGNRFNFLAKEENDTTALMREDYVIADAMPQALNLSEDRMSLLRVNYPKMITKLYPAGSYLYRQFTLNNNDASVNFQTMGDAVNYALAVYQKNISDINVYEEQMIKSMIVDYSNREVVDKRYTQGFDDFIDKIYIAILNVQNNSSKHNEALNASGGYGTPYSTYTPLSDLFILTTDDVKYRILDSKVANTFQVAGLDLTNKIISFDDLGGAYRLTNDVKLQNSDTVKFLNSFTGREMSIGDTIFKDEVMPFDVSNYSEFNGNVEEIVPTYQSGYLKKITFLQGNEDYSKFNNVFQENNVVFPFYSRGDTTGVTIDNSDGKNDLVDLHINDTVIVRSEDEYNSIIDSINNLYQQNSVKIKVDDLSIKHPDYFAGIYDINSIGYKRKTSGMLDKPFYNPKFGETNYYLRYYAQRYMRPFFNKVAVYGSK